MTNFAPDDSIRSPNPVNGGHLLQASLREDGNNAGEKNYTQMAIWSRNSSTVPRNSELVQLKTKLSMTEDQLHRSTEIINHLQGLVKDLVSQLEQERKKCFEDPFVDNWAAGNLRYTPLGPVSPIAVRNSGTGRAQLSPAVSYTPTTQQTPRDSLVLGMTPSTSRRHKRTETPEQLFLKPHNNGVRLYTMGIGPQDTRGLLHDFFNEIYDWARTYVKDLDDRGVVELSRLPDLADMLSNKSNVEHMLADKEMRQDVVAALINRHVVHFAVGEHFIDNSNHPAGEKCNQLFLEYAHLLEEEYGMKHNVCQKQKILYTELKNEDSHKKWRTLVAEDRSQALLSEIAAYLKPGVYPNRDHKITELYVKGYRIGFRLRMEPVKWQIMWPVAGVEVNFKWMINRTRNLYGDPTTTNQRVTENPSKYFVRFAVTPTFTSSDFSSGVEQKSVAHSALVHIGHHGILSHKHDASAGTSG